MSVNRRDFLRLSCCSAAAAAFMSGMSRFGLISAYAQSASDYKALVCVFLFGGNDGNNLIVPFDTTGYATYSSLRGGLALPQAQLLPVTAATSKRQLGLHPQLAGVQTLFQNNHAALVANVGLLIAPVTRTQFLARQAAVPSNLFSHLDQQTQWQTLVPQSGGTTGWAGRAADRISSANAPAVLPTIISVAGANIFCTGTQTSPAVVTPGDTSGFRGFDTSATATARNTAMQQLLTFDTGVSLVQAASGITSQAFRDSKLIGDALASAPTLATVFPNTSIGNQMLQIARIIQVRAALGMKRQIFFASMGGYDTHSNQLTDQSNLLGQLSPALSAFYDATVELGVSSSVTSFTMSEFGRTMQQASGGGSDHAWGSNHIVLGGAVKGGDLYGTLPAYALGGPDDAGNEGRWIPTTSLDQYAATLATWFGVSAADLPAVFPNLKNFVTPSMGFMS